MMVRSATADRSSAVRAPSDAFAHIASQPRLHDNHSIHRTPRASPRSILGGRMHTVTRRILAAAGFAFVLAASAALAQNPPTVRVRGTIEKVDGDTLIVRSRDGAELKVVPAPDARIVAIVKATAADIKQGSFVGVT